VLAAEIIINRTGKQEAAIRTLQNALRETSGPALLQVAISVRNIGARAKPLLPLIQSKVYPRIQGDVWGRYENWMYPMFIGMALDQTLINCGLEVNIRN
jgi:uncharacterized sulfatase